jgi:hypothetical protein
MTLIRHVLFAKTGKKETWRGDKIRHVLFAKAGKKETWRGIKEFGTGIYKGLVHYKEITG